MADSKLAEVIEHPAYAARQIIARDKKELVAAAVKVVSYRLELLFFANRGTGPVPGWEDLDPQWISRKAICQILRVSKPTIISWRPFMPVTVMRRGAVCYRVADLIETSIGAIALLESNLCYPEGEAARFAFGIGVGYAKELVNMDFPAKQEFVVQRLRRAQNADYFRRHG